MWHWYRVVCCTSLHGVMYSRRRRHAYTERGVATYAVGECWRIWNEKFAARPVWSSALSEKKFRATKVSLKQCCRCSGRVSNHAPAVAAAPDCWIIGHGVLKQARDLTTLTELRGWSSVVMGQRGKQYSATVQTVSSPRETLGCPSVRPSFSSSGQSSRPSGVSVSSAVTCRYAAGTRRGWGRLKERAEAGVRPHNVAGCVR
jgi:hypothetical protein